MKPLSIIIPVYNAAQYIPNFVQNLDHALADSIEWIFINDGSLDNSWELLKNTQSHYPQIVILDKPNGGAASARNKGIQNAKGKYIIFVDIDDAFELPHIINKLAWIDAECLDLFVYKYDYVNKKGIVNAAASSHPITYNTINSGLYFLEEGYQPSSICVFILLKSFIISNNLYFVEGITHEDVEVSLRYMLSAQRVYFSNEIWYHYYQREESVTNQLTAEKKKAYLLDEVTVATLMKAEEEQYTGQIKKVIQKNYNSVTWNLLYSIYKEPGQLDKLFVTEVLERLKASKLYPIKGPLKTKFQSALRIIMNIQPVWRQLSLRKLR